MITSIGFGDNAPEDPYEESYGTLVIHSSIHKAFTFFFCTLLACWVMPFGTIFYVMFVNKLWSIESGSDTDAAELAAVLENVHPSRFCVVLKLNQTQSSWHRRAREIQVWW